SRRLIIKEVSLLGPNVVWAQNAERKWRLPGARGGGLADEAPESDAASVPPVAGNAGPTPDAAQTGAPAVPDSDLGSQPETRNRRSVFIPQMRRINITDGNFRFLDGSGRSVAMFEGVRFHSSIRDPLGLRGSVSVDKISLRDRFFLQRLQ